MIDQVTQVMSWPELSALRKSVRDVHVESKVLSFIAEIVNTTRNHKSIYLGASPRASIGILQGAKAIAAMEGRSFVTPEDIIYVCTPVLRHRIVLTPDKEMEGLSTDELIKQIIQQIEVPR